MQCHYCEREADVSVEKDGVRVGVCSDHFRDRMAELADSESLQDVEEQLDVDSPE